MPRLLVLLVLVLAAAGLDDTTIPSTETTDQSATDASSDVPPTTDATPTSQPTTLEEAETTTNAPTTTNSPTTPTSTAAQTVTVKFVGDLHYNLLPVTATSDPCKAGAEDTQCFGGLPCLSMDPHKDPLLWLHTGVALGHRPASQEGRDLFRTVKYQHATNALGLLAFDAMSLDADMFRYGTGHAQDHMAALNKTSRVVCANCNGAAGSNVQTYHLKQTTTTTCAIAVIGIISKQKASLYLHDQAVLEEVEAVKKSVEQIKKDSAAEKIMFVVIGEATADTAAAILNQVTEVSVVLHSGDSDITAANASSTVDVSGVKKLRASQPAAMVVGQAALSLDPSSCMLSAEPTVTYLNYGGESQDKCKAADEVKTVVAELQKAVAQAEVQVGSASLTLSGNLDTCGTISCAVGQLTAEGVRAELNAGQVDWGKATRAVVIPAAVFSDKVLAVGGLSANTLHTLLQDDDYICEAELGGQDLHSLMETMLSSSATFPQLAGMRLDVDWRAAQGSRLVTLWLQAADLSMRPVYKADGVQSIGVPCQYLERDLPAANPTLAATIKQKTSAVLLSDGLLWHLKSSLSALPALPLPQVESRVAQYLGFPSRDALCEDMVGTTVCYTLLVVGALLLLVYQGYQFWRFRSTLSYVR